MCQRLFQALYLHHLRCQGLCLEACLGCQQLCLGQHLRCQHSRQLLCLLSQQLCLGLHLHQLLCQEWNLSCQRPALHFHQLLC